MAEKQHQKIEAARMRDIALAIRTGYWADKKTWDAFLWQNDPKH
jgi:hypothetical protein